MTPRSDAPPGALRLALVGMVLLITLASLAGAGPVIVRTKPPVAGARIFVDGVHRATTAGDGTFLLTGLAAGQRRVRLVLPDGGEITQVHTVAAGELAGQLLIEIPRELLAPGGAAVGVLVSGNVGNALVELDGRVQGYTGAADGSRMVEAGPGRHRIRLSADGYEAQEKAVVLEPGPVTRVSFQLRRTRTTTRATGAAGNTLLTWVLAITLLVAVVAVSVVAIHVIRRAPRQRVTTRRLDRYEMREVIGRGGMATVYKAHDTANRAKAPVALKVLDEAHLEDADLVRKFLREGEVLERLNRADPDAPLVRVFHYGRAGGDSGRPFIAMELLEGEDLLRHLKRRGRLPMKEACLSG